VCNLRVIFDKPALLPAFGVLLNDKKFERVPWHYSLAGVAAFEIRVSDK